MNTIIEQRRPGFLISTDPTRLQTDVIHAFLSERSYWAKGRSVETVQRSIDHSLCFGLYAIENMPDGTDSATQIGFSRVVTDYATFAWLCDVFIIESQRGRGLSKWMVETVVAHPDLAGIRRIVLATQDAHELYHKYGGFEILNNPERWMARFNPNV
jgi:GNAT superfamily N-acetyltransferase